MSTTPNVRHSLDEFFAVHYQLFENFLANQPDFAAYKPIYTVVFGTDMKAYVNTTSLMPDYNQRRNVAAGILSLNVKRNKEYILRLNELTGYIEEAFPGTYHAKLIEADFDNFKHVKKNAWDIIKIFAGKIKAFVNKYNTELTDDGGMPESFKTDLLAKGDTLVAAIDDYYNKKALEPLETEAITKRINEIVLQSDRLVKDAKRIYQQDTARRNLFTYSEIYKNMFGIKPGGIKGWVCESENKVPLTGASVSIVKEGILPKNTQTEAHGRFLLDQLEEGVYTVTVNKNGYADHTSQHRVKPGVRGQMRIYLQALPVLAGSVNGED